MGAIIQLEAPLAEYKQAHDEITNKMARFGQMYVNKIATKIGYAQDELMQELIDELHTQADLFSDECSSGQSCVKFKLALDYGWGGNSTLGTAVLTLKNNYNGTADIATAFFGEKWIEEDNVRLIDGCWPDWQLERFLVYRLIQKIPKNALEWSLVGLFVCVRAQTLPGAT